MAGSLSSRDWLIRAHIYQFFVERGRPPSTSETASHFRMAESDARDAYQRLHDAHTILLEPGTTNVRMANPLSAVETPFRVTANGRTYFANCAWDSLGIPAMLGTDATVEAAYTEADGSTTSARYQIVNDELQGDGLVHFTLPFRRWYEDQIHT